jgi:hypothetical protein
MADERLAALQAEIEAKQLEVERIIAEEAKKNTVPPLIEALEEVVAAQAALDEAQAAATTAGAAWQLRRGKDVPVTLEDHAKAAREKERLCLERFNREFDEGSKRGAEDAAAEASMYETCVASAAAGARAATAKDKMLKALIRQAREDAETKRANADMFESLLAQMAALQARVTTLEEEKAAKDRLAEETIRSLGYVPV